MSNDMSLIFKPEYQNYSNWYGNYKELNKKNSLKPQTPIQEREKFINKQEHIYNLLSFTAGLASIWRFPYLIFKNGGGVFLIPYFILLFLFGIPLLYFETAIGQMYLRGST